MNHCKLNHGEYDKEWNFVPNNKHNIDYSLCKILGSEPRSNNSSKFCLDGTLFCKPDSNGNCIKDKAINGRCYDDVDDK